MDSRGWREITPAVMMTVSTPCHSVRRERERQKIPLEYTWTNRRKELTRLDDVPQHNHLPGVRKVSTKAERVPVLLSLLDPLYRLALQLDLFNLPLAPSNNAYSRPALRVHMSKGPADPARGAQYKDAFVRSLNLVRSTTSFADVVEGECGGEGCTGRDGEVSCGW